MRSYRTYMLVVLTSVYAFNFMDRNVLGLLLEPIKNDLRLSDTQLGLLTGIAFALFYSTLGIPIARLADRGNRISIITITIMLWSVMVLCCGFAANFVQLIASRVGVAVGEAGCVPPAQSLIADYYARSERPRAMSAYMLGGPISVVVAYAVGGWINDAYGWRMAFFAIGLPGFLLSLLVWSTLKEPRSGRPHAPITEVDSYRAVFSALWRKPAYRHLVIAFTLIYLFSYGIGQWVPPFLIRTRHIHTSEIGGWYSLIWGIGGIAGTYLGGVLADRFARNNERRQLVAMGGALIGFIPLYLAIYLVSVPTLIFSLMAVGALIYCSIFGPLFALIQDVVPAQHRAISIAIVMLFSNLIGMGLGPIAVGFISDMLKPAFGIASLQMALLMWTPGYLWAAVHLLRARSFVAADLASSHASDMLFTVNPVASGGR